MGELFDELHLPQVIVVSHETQLMSIADRSLRVRKEDGRSTVGVEGAGVKEPGERTRAAAHRSRGPGRAR